MAMDVLVSVVMCYISILQHWPDYTVIFLHQSVGQTKHTLAARPGNRVDTLHWTMRGMMCTVHCALCTVHCAL